jgi:hypothetical protein
MAGAAGSAQGALVRINCRVAGIAVAGCAPEDVIDMTFQAGDRVVLAGQLECRLVVVKGGWFPCSG